MTKEKVITSEFIRFVIVGLLATAIHYGVYLLLDRVIPANPAYAAGYVILLEAGGRMDGWHPWLEPLSTGSILAGNGLVNDALSKILNPASDADGAG